MKLPSPLPLHPVLYGVFTVLSLYAFNVAQSSAADLPLPLALVVGGSLALWLLLWVILRDPAKAALALTLCLVVFFSYGHIYGLVMHLKAGDFRFGRHRFLLPLFFAALAALLYLTLRARSIPSALTRFLNLTTAILIALTVGNIAYFKLMMHRAPYINTPTASQPVEAAGPGVNRDVYYIVMDGYANDATLREVYHYDNSAFLNRLRELDFRVVNHAFSNYNQTNVSLPSVFQMEYMDSLGYYAGIYSTDPSIPWRYIRRGAVWQRMRELGYRLALIRSGWGPTDRNDFVDQALRCSRYNEFIKMLTHTTMLCVVERKLIVVDWHRDNVRKMAQTLEGMGLQPGPKFVFMHFPLPHAPFVFGANGESVPPVDVTFGQNIWVPRENYPPQLQYAGRLILKAIERILKESSVTPIILLTSDHGPATLDQWHNPSDEFLKERHGALWAALLPDAPPEAVPDTLTLVNSFRILFNAEFNAGLPLLENRVYHSTLEHPYDFLEVTERLLGSKVVASVR